MQRANYDTDVTVWSPQGRLFQVEYAMEAVKQGATVVGLKSRDTVVLCSQSRRQGVLESYQQKLFKIDDHIAVGIAGLTADARILHKQMRNECLNHKYAYETPMNCGRLAGHLGRKAQKATQTAEKRPFGVGMLIAGADKTGVHLYETCPSGNVYDYISMAIGGRSQSAKTYLEKHFRTFEDAPEEELIRHGLQALIKCLDQDTTLIPESVSVCVIGLNSNFKKLTESEIVQALEQRMDIA